MNGPRRHGGRGRGQGGGRPKNFKLALKSLVRNFKPYAGLLIVVMILLLFVNLAIIYTPIHLNTIMTGLADGKYFYPGELTRGLNFSLLLVDIGIIIGLILLSTVLRTVANLLSIRVSAGYSYKLRKDIKEKLDRLPLSYFDKYTHGEILAIGTNDVDAISQSLNQVLAEIFNSVVLFVGTLIAMFVVSWQLALVALGILPLSVLVSVFITKRSQKQFVKFQDKQGELEGKVEENFAGLPVVQLFNQQGNQIAQFVDINNEMAHANFISQWLSSFIFPSLRFVSNLGFLGVLVVVGVINNIAVLPAFIIFLNNFQQPFFQIGQLSNTIQTTLAGAERVFGLLEEEEQSADAEDAVATNEKVKGEFCFKKVAFSYTPERKLITDLDLHVNPGDTIAIVGPTGAGKTTLVNLIMRFYEINEGKITLDGIDIRDYTRSALRSSVGMVLQDTWLFKGSIRNNIRYGNKDATEEQIIAAAKAARAHHFITTLPGEYDFVLNEDGTNISQGQRQLLTIARAIIADPKILILDEATSSVDTRTEFAIQKVMDEIMKNRTTFIIAHRLSTIKNAKNILVMHNGDIIETGKHDELLKADGFYASLYNAQFLGIDNENNNNDKSNETS